MALVGSLGNQNFGPSEALLAQLRIFGIRSFVSTHFRHM